MSESSSNSEGISVAIRVRPLNERELSSGQGNLFKAQTSCNAISQLKDNQPLEGQTYYYDKVFDEDATNSDAYDFIAKDLVQGVVRGINGTIFAYGQTSSGKTFTMLGGGGQRGVIELAADEIFAQIANSPNRDFLLRVSFVEIYNENIRDLLTEAADATVNIREDPRKGVYCEASEVIITDLESISRALRRGNSKRTVEATTMNETSSRSHTIFKIVIESKESMRAGADPDGAVLVASLNLVDLAGSESVRHTGATGQRAKEGGKINQSLLSLSRVIHGLSTPGTHISFRDSKLTRLLQPSLSGNAKMSIICCITSADRYLEETRSTLQFASRAKLVKTHAKVNEVLDETSQLKRLKKELEDLKEKQRSIEGGNADGSHARIEAEKFDLLEKLKEMHEEKRRQMVVLDHYRDLIDLGGGSSASTAFAAGSEALSPVLEEQRSKVKKTKRETWCPPRSQYSLADKENDGNKVTLGDVNDTRIPLLIEQIHALKSQVSYLQSSEAVAKSRCDEWIQCNHEKEDYIKELRSAHDELVQNIEVEIGARNECEREIRVQLKKYEVEISELSQSKRDVSQMLVEKDQVILDLQFQVSQLQESLATVSQTAAALTEISSLAQEKESHLLQQSVLIETLQTEKSFLAENLQAIYDALDVFDSASVVAKYCQATTDHESVKSFSEIVSLQLDDCKAQHFSEIDELQTRLQQLENEKREYESNYKEATNVIANMQEDIRALQMQRIAEVELLASNANANSELEQSNKLIVKALQSQLDSVTTQLDEAKKEILKFEAEKSDFYVAYDKLSNCQAEISNAEELVACLEGDCEQLKSDLQSSHAREETLSQAIEDADSEILSFKDQIDVLEKQLEGVIEDCRLANLRADEALNVSMASESSAVESFRLKISDLESKIVDLTSERESLILESNHSVEAISHQLNAKENELVGMRDKMFIAEEQVGVLEAEISKIGPQNAFITQQLEANEEEFANLRAQIIAAKEEAKDYEIKVSDMLSQKISEHMEVVATLKNELNEMSAKFHALEAEIAAGSVVSIEEDQFRQDNLKNLEIKCLTLEDSVAAMMEENSRVKEELIESDNKVVIFAEECASLQDQIKELSDALKLAQASKNETSNQMETVLQEKSFKNAQTEELTTLNISLSSTITGLLSELDSLKKEKSAIELKFDDLVFSSTNQLECIKIQETIAIEKERDFSAQLQSEIEKCREIEIKLEELNVDKIERSAQFIVIEDQLKAHIEKNSSLVAELDQVSADITAKVAVIESLQAQIQSMESEKKNLMDHYETLAEEKMRLEDKNSQLTADLESSLREQQMLTDALIEADNASSVTEELASKQTIAMLTETNEKLVFELQAFSEEIEALRAVNGELEISFQQSSCELSQSKSINAELDEVITNLNQEVAEWSEKYSLVLNDNASIKSVVEDLESSLRQSCDDRSGLLDSIGNLQGEVARRDDQLAEIQDVLNVLQEKGIMMNSLDEEKQQLLDEMNALMEGKLEAESRLSRAETEAKSLRDQLSEYDQASAREQEMIMRAAEAEMESLRCQLNSANSLHKTLQAECNRLTADLISKEDSVSELMNEMFELRNSASNEADNFRGLYDKAVQQRDEKLTIIEHLEKKVRHLTNACATCEQTLTSLRSEMAELIDIKDKRIIHLEASKLTKEQMEKIKIIKEERKKFQDEVKEMKKQLLNLKKAYEDLKASKASASTKNSSSTAEIADLQLSIREAEGKLESATNVIATFKEKLRDCSKQLKEYENERDAVLDVLEQNGVDITGLCPLDCSVLSEDISAINQISLSDAIGALVKRVTTNQKLSSAGTAADEMKSRFLSEISDLKAQKVALEKRTENLKSSNRDAREEVATLTAEIDDLKIRLEDVQEALKDARGQIDKGSEEVSSELIALQEENIELLAENKQLRKDVSSIKLQLDRLQQSKSSVAPLGSSNGNSKPKESILSTVGSPGKENGDGQLRRKRSLGGDLTKPSQSVIDIPDAPTAASSVDGSSGTRRTRAKAKPIVQEADAPGECNQS